MGIVKGHQIDLALTTEWEGQIVLATKLGKGLIEEEEEESIGLLKFKIVQVQITDLERQFVLDLPIEAVCKTDLELLPGRLVGQTVTIVQGFLLA